MKSLFLCVAVASVVATTACKSNKTQATVTDIPSASASASAVASAQPRPSGSGLVSPVAIPGATVATLPNMSIPARFGAELNGRPQGIKPTVEEVYAGLEKAGLTIVDKKQHLGSPFGARYCLGARAVGPNDAAMLQMSVCEFVTAEAAKIGREYSAEGMKMPLRTVYANKQTTLTLREEKQTPEIDALVVKAAAAYAGM